MKLYMLTWLILFSFTGFSQKAENIIIITTDGLRWQEVFKGMDSALANNRKFNQDDSLYLYKKYWDTDETISRKKLMPFFWSTIEQQGQLYGNRHYRNMADNANPYWFSYPGYNELFTGYPDTLINSNAYPPNPNINLLEFINQQPGYRNKVAAFGAWDAFDRILNEERSGFPVYSSFDKTGREKPGLVEQTINKLNSDSYKPFGEAECLDVFTHYAAMHYLETRKPKMLFIGYGETDEWAHSGHYKDYLDAAHMVDKWINDIWNYIQSTPFYKNKTVLFITTDHGRGDEIKEEWTSHNSKIKGAGQIWFAVMGPGIKRKGEVKKEQQFYQKQFAQTIANLISKEFIGNHITGDKINLNAE